MKHSELESLVRGDLKAHHLVPESYIHTLFQDKVHSDSTIQAFLEKSQLYNCNSRRWSGLPRAPRQDKDLYGPVSRIISDVQSSFGLGHARAVVGIWAQEGDQEDEDGQDYVKIAPDLMIVATAGRNFPPLNSPTPDTPIGLCDGQPTDRVSHDEAWHFVQEKYSFCTAPIEVKKSSEQDSVHELTQMTIYARQCFKLQQNRNFVYVLGLTEQHATVYRYDRSGLVYTPALNIHTNPITFVRILLGLSSLDDALLGFDTTTFYAPDGHRYVETIDGAGVMVAHEILDTHPVFSRDHIRGRGTTCRRVASSAGRTLLIKDAWRSKHLSPEHHLLPYVRGLNGVGQMVSYDPRELRVSEIRGKAALEGDYEFTERTFGRLVLEVYGRSIEQFGSRQQLLKAFHDAVAGHRNLWNVGILHRDVSVGNVLLGKKDATEGNRGILIDLDRAIRWDTPTPIQTDYLVGTKPFLSYLVLSAPLPPSSTPTSPTSPIPYSTYPHPVHDHLDDLESFFYVFCAIVLGYHAPRKPILPRPAILVSWEDTSRRGAADGKLAFLTGCSPSNYPTDAPLSSGPSPNLQNQFRNWKMSTYFGPIFLDLVLEMKMFLASSIFAKASQCQPYGLMEPRPPMRMADPQERQIRLEKAGRDYEVFLGFIGKALGRLEGDRRSGGMVRTLVSPGAFAAISMDQFAASGHGLGSNAAMASAAPIGIPGPMTTPVAAAQYLVSCSCLHPYQAMSIPRSMPAPMASLIHPDAPSYTASSSPPDFVTMPPPVTSYPYPYPYLGPVPMASLSHPAAPPGRTGAIPGSSKHPYQSSMPMASLSYPGETYGGTPATSTLPDLSSDLYSYPYPPMPMASLSHPRANTSDLPALQLVMPRASTTTRTTPLYPQYQSQYPTPSTTPPAGGDHHPPTPNPTSAHASNATRNPNSNHRKRKSVTYMEEEEHNTTSPSGDAPRAKRFRPLPFFDDVPTTKPRPVVSHPSRFLGPLIIS